MSRKHESQSKSRPLSGALAPLVFALVGAGLFWGAPAHADHWDHHHGGGVSFFFGVPFPLFPVPVPVYEPPRYHQPGEESSDRDEQPYYDEGHWRHEDGWDRRDENGEWTNERQSDRGGDEDR